MIDFAEMCAGDPATDLSAAWILLPAGAAQRFFDAYQDVNEATIARARGWAVLRALGLIDIGALRARAEDAPTWHKHALRRSVADR